MCVGYTFKITVPYVKQCTENERHIEPKESGLAIVLSSHGVVASFTFMYFYDE